MSDRIRTFDEFWDFYVSQHSQPMTRRFHFVGTLSTLACLAAFARSRRPRHLVATVVAGYGPAWISHFFIEKNRPATWSYPLWSLLADFKMFELMTRGLMDGEVARVMAARDRSSNGHGTAKHEPRTSTVNAN